MRISVAVAAALTGMGAAACGAANTAQTVPATVDTSTGATATVTPPAATATATTSHVLSSTTATPPRSSATITTTAITSPDSGGAALGTVTTAGTPRCLAGDLTLAAVGPNSAPGTAVLGFTVKNTGASSCHTGGWPGVSLYAAGASTPLTTSATRSTSDVLGSTPDTPIVLPPGAEASFRLVLSTEPSGGSSCHTATRAQFIAPEDTAPMRVTIPNGADYCGTATVSPLEPGASGTGQ